MIPQWRDRGGRVAPGGRPRRSRPNGGAVFFDILKLRRVLGARRIRLRQGYGATGGREAGPGEMPGPRVGQPSRSGRGCVVITARRTRPPSPRRQSVCVRRRVGRYVAYAWHWGMVNAAVQAVVVLQRPSSFVQLRNAVQFKKYFGQRDVGSNQGRRRNLKMET